MTLALPKRGRGRQSSQSEIDYRADLRSWTSGILKLNSGLDFKISSRGWCYILEDAGGLLKGDFDAAQRLINDCRKSGLLPIEICSEDDGRAVEGLESLDDPEVHAEACRAVENAKWWHIDYMPFSFWDTVDVYIEMAVEKVDLKSLFSPVCQDFHVPVFNASGWSDINSRAAMMRRFKQWEAKGKRCVLLYCGDHDPGGLNISTFLRSNLSDLSGAVGWSPDNLIIDRFGLDYEFIVAEGLTWIENLETGSGGRLDDPKHRDHGKPYVQNYLSRFGARKVEANALVVRPQAGRRMCRNAILKYVSEHDLKKYQDRINAARLELRAEIRDLLSDGDDD